MRTTENATVRFNDDLVTRHKVFEELLNFFIEFEAFSGELILQGDAIQIYMPQYLAGIVDDLMKFEVEWNE